MEQQNFTTSQHLQTPETIEFVPNLGACYLIDDNPENKDGGFDVTSDEKTVADSIDSDMQISDNDNTKYKRTDVTSDYKLEDDNGRLSGNLQNNLKASVVEEMEWISNNTLEDGSDERYFVELGGASAKRHNMVDIMSNRIADVKPQGNLDGRFDYVSPIDLVSNQSGYESDVDTMKDGESSGNVTDSDSETKKNLAEKAKLVIQKAIARLDSIDEEVAQIVAEEIANDKDSEAEEPGSSCRDTMVSDYKSTDLEDDTTIPRDILYKLLGREDNSRVRRCLKNAKRKLSAEDD